MKIERTRRQRCGDFFYGLYADVLCWWWHIKPFPPGARVRIIRDDTLSQKFIGRITTTLGRSSKRTVNPDGSINFGVQQEIDWPAPPDAQSEQFKNLFYPVSFMERV